LAAIDAFAGGVEGEPVAAVDFGEFFLAAGAERPLHGECVAAEIGGIAIAFERPRGNEFAARLTNLPEFEE
jgi:hypothetical protein